ncbi:hypothetical protein PLESTM_001768600 [Pleodorina starrii]|nr:hypothetical protein PLESTM_001768600 [Pleodorina starrii]
MLAVETFFRDEVIPAAQGLQLPTVHGRPAITLPQHKHLMKFQAVRIRTMANGYLQAASYMSEKRAVAAINRGASRLPDSRAISRQIAELAVRHGFELRAEHISGSDNVRADSLSRRLAEADDQQLRLKPSVFEGLCGSGPFKPSVDCCCDNAGFNRQGGCGTFFSPGSSVVGQERALAGHVLWAFPPKALVGEVLGTIRKAWDLDRGTRATVVVPHWPERPWFDWFVRRRLFRVEGTLPRGSRVCLWPWGAEADPAPYDFLVLRLP